MVRDGIYYALGLSVLAVIIGVLTTPWLAIVPLLFAAFFLWFFRDPERAVPHAPGLIVSPADGKVTDVSNVAIDGAPRTRISIFLNVFDVHVNRSPIAGTITAVRYQKGRFGNAMANASSEANEQNVITLQGQGQTIVLRQIAGLLARRLVFNKQLGEQVARGERIGMMKFGSRMDVIMDPSVTLQVKLGDRVKGGVTVLATSRATTNGELITAGEQRAGVEQ
jgi:phosphatidylserine decarboxylase